MASAGPGTNTKCACCASVGHLPNGLGLGIGLGWAGGTFRQVRVRVSAGHLRPRAWACGVCACAVHMGEYKGREHKGGAYKAREQPQSPLG